MDRHPEDLLLGPLESRPHTESIHRQILVDWVWASGIHGIKKPQTLLGVNPDGHVGPATLAAINDYSSQRELFDKIKQARLDFVDDICHARPANERFRRGWCNRINAFVFAEG